jgi:4'-phosphopantetheinyl transferase
MHGDVAGWVVPPTDLEIPRGEVHVWRTRLDQPDAVVERLARLLSADETARADRFHFDLHRRRFIIGRGTLRILLGRYLGADPAQLTFSIGAWGKPALAGETACAGIRFNLAHSHDLALHAFARECELGVDLEKIRPMAESENIVARFFSPGERRAFTSLPDEEKPIAFFRCWTRKEAYMKANGMGFSIRLDQFEVSLEPDAPARLVEVKGHAQESVRWHLIDLAPDTEFSAALAAEGQGWTLRLFEHRLAVSI